MERDGRPILAVPDHRDHLAAFARGTAGDEGGEQRVSDASVAQVVVNIDRVFDRESISRPQTVRRRIAIAGHHPIHFGDKVWQATVEDVGATTAQFINAGRFLFE
jgi:hypothetical protein